MLPKQEKTKRLNNNYLSDSEITKESEEVVSAKKVKSKRHFILISLVCTAGLSLVFWTINGIKSFTANPKPLDFHLNFKLPSIKFKSTDNSSNQISSSDLDKFLSDKNWSVVIFKNNDLSTPVYQSNYSNSNTDSLISELSKIKSTETSDIISGLPEGLLFQEKIDISSNPYLYANIISLPNNQLTFIIQDNSQQQNFSQNISSFINQAYWYSISQN